jgi:DNA-binding protein HU-beta
MIKSELIKSIAEKASLTKEDSEAVLKGFLESIEETVAKGEKVQLVGFGSFEPRDRAARMGRNPRTKEEIPIAATTVPFFKAGKEFKDLINK